MPKIHLRRRGLSYFYVLFFHPSLGKIGLRLSDVDAGTFIGMVCTLAMTKAVPEAGLASEIFLSLLAR